jgi:hypothetical protein
MADKNKIELKKELTKLAASIDSLVEQLKKDEVRSEKTAGHNNDNLDFGVVSNIPQTGMNPLLKFILE